MSDYWLEHYTNAASTHAESPLKQVGKTVNGIEVGDEQITLISEHIAKALALTPTDTLLDLCCGNGLLTMRLAEYANMVTGIDFTEGLLEVARKRHARNNILYQLGNILSLSSTTLASTSCFSMYEGLQHLSIEQFSKLMSSLSQQPALTRFFIGGIPDRRRIHSFYDTDEKFRFYQACEQEGRPHLGRWWLEDEIRDLSAQAGYTMQVLAQPTGVYSAYYRFDVLLEKQE